MEQFSNIFIFDTNEKVWTKVESTMEGPRWNFAAVGVFAVPYWKVFVFGGNSGDLYEGGNPQGTYLNDMMVLETGDNSWSRPQTLGTIPVERGETPIVYDSKQSRIVMFGGWANRWFGDLYVCKVGDVVGPPYSITSISPVMGPITGQTTCVIQGMGFRSSGTQATIRFACIKGVAEVPGEVLSDSEIKFETPNYEKYGAISIEGRVSVGGKSFTNSSIGYNYFSVASHETSLVFGPAVLEGCVAVHPVSLVIQARDAAGANRVCGMDEFTLTLQTITYTKKGAEVVEPTYGDGKEIGEEFPYTVKDQDDGTYLVTFSYPAEGFYELGVEFMGTFMGKAGPVRGAPFRVNVAPASDDKSVNNDMTGPLMMKHIQDKVKEIKDYSSKAVTALKKAIPKDEVDALIKVKEVLKDVEARKTNIELSTDSNKAALAFFKGKGQQVDKMIEQLDHTATLWQDVVKQAPVTQNSIVPLVKTWSVQISDNIEKYGVEMSTKLKDFKKLPFWDDSLSPEEAVKAMEDAEKFLADEAAELARKTQLCATFDFPHLVKNAKECMDEMQVDLQEMKKLWSTFDNLKKFVEESRGVLWSEMNMDDLDEQSKNQVKYVKNMHKCVRWSKAYQAADKMSKDFLNTIPLVSLLAAKCMKDRHWDSLKAVTKKEFISPLLDKALQLGGILALNLHEFSGDVEDICDQAAKELKIENSLNSLTERWKIVEWLMEPYKDTDVPLLKMGEEDFESLEADQLTVQGMLASRFVKVFEEDAQVRVNLMR